MNKKAPTKEKYVIMPDSFKGTMDAIEVCRIMETSIKAYDPRHRSSVFPSPTAGKELWIVFFMPLAAKKKKRR